MGEIRSSEESSDAQPSKAAVAAKAGVALRAAPGPKAIVSSVAGVDPREFLEKLIRQFGDVVRYQTRMGECFLFVKPDHVQTILHRENYRRASLVKMILGNGMLTSDGPVWRSLRRLTQKDFLPAALRPFGQIITRETQKTADAWAAAAVAGEPVDVTTAMVRLTLRIVLESLFSDDLSVERSTELCDAFTDTIVALGRISSTIFGVPMNFAPDSNTRFAASKKIIDAACLEMIERRRAMPPGSRPRDLLTLLIDGDTNTGPLNDIQLRDEVVTMIVGGHETTALALAWTFKLLGEHPEIEQRIFEEIDRVLGDRIPAVDDVANLKYIQAVLEESMRLYPPVWYLARVAGEADVIDGYAIPRGACVMVSAWFTQRDPKLWTDPLRFDPARFLDSSQPPAHRYAYFPFAGGRHQCIGMHLALMEATLVLAQLFQQFRMGPGNYREVKPDAGITLRQSPLLLARFLPRTPQAAPAVPVAEGA